MFFNLKNFRHLFIRRGERIVSFSPLFRMILKLEHYVTWSPPSAIPKEIEPNRSSIYYTRVREKGYSFLNKKNPLQGSGDMQGIRTNQNQSYLYFLGS